LLQEVKTQHITQAILKVPAAGSILCKTSYPDSILLCSYYVRQAKPTKPQPTYHRAPEITKQYKFTVEIIFGIARVFYLGLF
jgi:hypothetical protein